MNSDRIEGVAREAVGKVEKTAGHLAGDASTEARGRVEELAGVAQRAYGNAKEAVRDFAGDVADGASEYGQRYASRAADAGQRYYRDGNRVVSHQIGEQQIAALLVAGAAGYLLGWLIHGRR